MNAAEQATDVQLASKIAAVVNLFKTHFPDARADLKPWANDPDTRARIDPDSIDIGFHWPGWSPRFQSRSMLVQLRFFDGVAFEADPEAPSLEAQTQDSKTALRLIGLEVLGFTYNGEQWRLSTVADWTIVGDKTPVDDVIQSIKTFCRQVFELFNK